MKTPTLLALATSTSIATADLTLFEIPEPFTLASLPELSADGSTVTVDLLQGLSGGSSAHTWRDGDWTPLPFSGDWVLNEGISADGSMVLFKTVEFAVGWGLSVLDGAGAVDVGVPVGAQSFGDITRDGGTVFSAEFVRDAGGPVSLWRWQSGIRSSLGQLSGEFHEAKNLIAGNRDNLFAVEAVRLAGPETGRRVLLYNDGAITEFGSVFGLSSFHTRLTDMNADGTVILGSERGSFGDSVTLDVDADWIYRDGSFQELAIEGYDTVRGAAVSDDGSVIVGSGRNLAKDDFDVFLMHKDGRLEFVEDLLANEGVLLGHGEGADITDISADGTVISGVIGRDEVTPFGVRFTLFTLTVPAPGALALFGLAVSWSSRRRR